MATRWTSKHTGQKIDDTIDYVCNPNLLDNGYFVNPVDQRGGYVIPPGTKYFVLNTSTLAGTTSTYVKVNSFSTSGLPIITIDGTQYNTNASAAIRGYTGSGYGIDRWKATNNNTTVVISNGFINLSGKGAVPYIANTLEFPSPVLGKVVTLSVLLEDGTLKSSKSTLPASLPSANTLYCNIQDVADLLGTSSYFSVRIKAKSGDSNSIVAVKLELGSQQTLAHQDADGNWVLNEIPYYGEQLARCQRYFIRIGVPAAQENSAIGFANCANTTLANSYISTPVTMRALPTATMKNIVLRKGITDFNVTACNIFSITGNGIYMNFTSSGLTTGDTLLIRTVTGGYIDFTADL